MVCAASRDEAEALAERFVAQTTMTLRTTHAAHETGNLADCTP
jgi:hypothetical protein